MFKVFAFFCCLTFSIFAKPIFFIGIAGGSGSGKTTFAKKILEAFPNMSLISQDSYYKDLSTLPMEKREKINFDHPDSLEFDLLQKHLIDLKHGRSIEVPVYNFHSHCREPRTQTISPSQIVVIEGILILAMPEIRELLDLKIFIDTDDDIRIIRRLERDITERSRDFKSIKNQYLESVKPMHNAFVEPSKKYADVIVPEGGYNAMAVDLILSKLNQLLVD